MVDLITEYQDAQDAVVGDNDDDWDDDGVPNDDETNTSLMGTDPWDPDTDDDGFCDGPIAFEGLCHAGPDPYPLNASAPVDTDGDGTGDNSDKFPTVKFYQTYGQAAVHLIIGLIILGVIGFSVRMGIGGRTEKPEADESAHEIREIAGVEVRVSAEDLFDDEPEAEAEPEPTLS